MFSLEKQCLLPPCRLYSGMSSLPGLPQVTAKLPRNNRSSILAKLSTTGGHRWMHQQVICQEWGWTFDQGETAFSLQYEWVGNTAKNVNDSLISSNIQIHTYKLLSDSLVQEMFHEDKQRGFGSGSWEICQWERIWFITLTFMFRTFLIKQIIVFFFTSSWPSVCL